MQKRLLFKWQQRAQADETAASEEEDVCVGEEFHCRTVNNMAEFKVLTSDNKLDMSLDELIAAQQQKSGGTRGSKGPGAAGQQQRGAAAGVGTGAAAGTAGAAAGGHSRQQQTPVVGRRLATQTRQYGGPYGRPPPGFVPGAGAAAPNMFYRDAVGRDYLLEATNAGAGGRHGAAAAPGGVGGGGAAEAAAAARGPFVPYVYTVKAKNLPVNLSEEELEDALRRHFSCCGRVVRIVFRRGVPGEAYVGFQDASSCGKALAELQGSKLRGSPIAIEKGLPTLPGGTGYYPPGPQQRVGAVPLHGAGGIGRGGMGGGLYGPAAPAYLTTRRGVPGGGQQQLLATGRVPAAAPPGPSSSSSSPPYNYGGAAAASAAPLPYAGMSVPAAVGYGGGYAAAADGRVGGGGAAAVPPGGGVVAPPPSAAAAAAQQQQHMVMHPHQQQHLPPSQQQQAYPHAAARISGLLGHYPSGYGGPAPAAAGGAPAAAANAAGTRPPPGGAAATRDIYAVAPGLPYTNGDVADVYGSSSSAAPSHAPPPAATASSYPTGLVGKQAAAAGGAPVAARAAATVIVSNVPCDLTAAELQDAFAIVGTVLQTELLLNAAGYPTGRVAITYSTRQAAVEAVRRFDGGDLNAHTIRVFLE